MNRDEMKLFIPKSLIDDPEITGLDLSVYIQLNICSIKIFEQSSCVGLGSIAYQIFGAPDKHRAELQRSFDKLPHKFPDYFTATADKRYIITNFYNKIDEFLIQIPLTDYDAIMNSDYSYKINLIKVYLIILSTARSFIKANGVGYLGTNYTYDWYATLCGCVGQTFSNYVTCLEKLELIYVYRPKGKEKTNIIGRKKNEKSIKKWAIENNYGSQERDDANRRRSLMAKFNYLVKLLEEGKPCPYSSAEVDEIRNCVIEHNRFCQIQSKIDKSYLEKIKDFALLDRIKRAI